MAEKRVVKSSEVCRWKSEKSIGDILESQKEKKEEKEEKEKKEEEKRWSEKAQEKTVAVKCFQ